MALRRFLGARIRRKEDPKLLTGAATYLDDVRPPGTLHVAFVRSPHAHAEIKRVDASKAEALGALFVLTGEDLKATAKPLPCFDTDPDVRTPPRFPLAVGKVRYVGEPVAAVVASSRHAAADAAELVEVEYAPLEVVTDPEKALEAGAPVLHEGLGSNLACYKKLEAGDVDGAFRGAELVVGERLTIQRLAPVPLECRGVVASYEKALGSLTVWLSTQAPHVLRSRFSELFGIPENRIRVIAPDVGGGFGAKCQLYSDEIAVCLLALALGKPVKWVESRRENLLATHHGRSQIHYVELALKRDGAMVGLKDRIVADYGAYNHLLTPASSKLTMSMLPGNYTIRNLRIELYGVFTNKMSVDPYRGAGRPEATYVIERMVDLAARELRMDPVELRLKNFIPAERFPYKTATGVRYDTGDYAMAMRKAVEISDYAGLRREQEALRRMGKCVGIGVAAYVEICGFGPSEHMPERWGGYESATVRVTPDGKITVYTGTSSHGQGHETPFAQIVAEELGVDVDDVVVVHGDTAAIPYGMGTYGSRSMFVGGHAVLSAARRVREKARQIAAQLLEASVEDVELRDGKYHVKGAPMKALTLREIAEEAYFMKRLPKGFEPGLEATSFHEPASTTFPFGVHIAVVSVDTETGAVRLEKYFAVDDCGTIINPLIVEGQIHGGVAQAIGQALYEELIFDKSGQLQNASLMEYYTPSAPEIPSMITEHTYTPSETPLGVKGVGEAGTIVGTAAVVNAIADALAPYGVKVSSTPVKPETVWRLLRGKHEL